MPDHDHPGSYKCQAYSQSKLSLLSCWGDRSLVAILDPCLHHIVLIDSARFSQGLAGRIGRRKLTRSQRFW